MRHLPTIEALRDWRQEVGGESLGFVPTMGALHAGHRTLIEQSVAENDHFEYSVFDLMSGERVSNERKRALPVVEYERAMRFVPAAQSWYKWVQVLGAEVEFDVNIEQTIRKALDRVAQARETRAQGTTVRTVAAAS